MVFQPRKQFIVGDDHHVLESVRKESEIVTLFLKRKLYRITCEDEAARTDYL
jgi:hypothetical protein